MESSRKQDMSRIQAQGLACAKAWRPGQPRIFSEASVMLEHNIPMGDGCSRDGQVGRDLMTKGLSVTVGEISLLWAVRAAKRRILKKKNDMIRFVLKDSGSMSNESMD